MADLNRYSFSEPIKPLQNYQYLSVESLNSPLLRIFRILGGTVNIVDDFKEKETKLRTNFFALPYHKLPRVKKSSITDNFNEDVSLIEISNFFKSTVNSNKNFYKTIEIELIKCILAREEKRYLEAFLFIYRIIEGISYSLPLIYTSKAKDYKRSYTLLKSFMTGNKESGELNFFKKFVSEVYRDEAFYTSSIDLDVTKIEMEELREPYYKLYRNKIKDTHLADETEYEELKIKFIGYLDFIVELRNRYFHFLQGSWQENLSSSQVIHPDYFFRPLVDPSINWISIILFEIIKHDFDSN